MVNDDELAGAVLAAGLGTRLAPLTDRLPKALCPVGNRPLLDLALERVRRHVDEVAVNAHHHLDAMLGHLDGRDVHVSVERDRPLGTAGAIGQLAGWLDGRDVLVVNADAWSADDLTGLLHGWDRQAIRLLVHLDRFRPDFDGLWRFAGASLIPGSLAAGLPSEPSGLYEVLWERAYADGRLELIPTRAAFVDCGTPADYLAANLLASGGRTVVGPGAEVQGEAVGCVLWAGARVAPGERLHHAIRLGDGLTLTPLSDRHGS